MAVIDGKWLSKEGLTYFWSKIKTIFTKQTETNVVANLGAKNVLKLSLTTQTKSGITFTVNDDQTITVTGTLASNASNVYITIATVSGLSGDYILSGCPSGGSGSTYRLYRAGSSSSESDIGEGYTYTFEPQNTHAIRIYLYAGNTFNLTFKPMLRPAEITDNTFQKYAPSNRELYETRYSSKDILHDSVDLDDIKTGGIYNGVTSTGNSAIHMPVANGSFMFVLTVIEANESIIQIFKQLNSAGDSNFYIRRFYIYNSDWDGWYPFTSMTKGAFDLTLGGSPLVASSYSYSCVTTGDVATVCFRLVLGADLDVSTSRLLFKLPRGYYPGTSVAGTGYADSKLRVFWINTVGELRMKIDELIPSGAAINANFSYSYKSGNWTNVTVEQS